MPEIGGERLQLATVIRERTEIPDSVIFANAEARQKQALERQGKEAMSQRTEVEEFLNSAWGEFFTAKERNALLSVLDSKNIVIAWLGSETMNDASPEQTKDLSEMLQEMLKEILKVLLEALKPDALDVALLALPIVGEWAEAARRAEKIAVASDKIIGILRKYEWMWLSEEAIGAVKKIFDTVKKSWETAFDGIDEAIRLFRWWGKSSKPITNPEKAAKIADELEQIKKELVLAEKETKAAAVLEVRVGWEGFINRLSQFFPKESLWKLEKVDIIAKQPELLYELEQFQLYLRTTNQVTTAKKVEFMKGYVDTMNSLLTRNGIVTNETTLTGIKKAITNLK